MRIMTICFVVVLLAFAALAQEQGEDDRSYLTRLLEENLSTDDQKVVIDGFTGALSSEATISELTIADGDGVWLQLEDVVLVWSRAALLRGRVEVDELSAQKIVLARLPAKGDQSPEIAATEYQGFSLPELPVSVNIGRVKVEQVNLGAAVLGQPMQMSVDGNLTLEGGDGSGALHLKRLDEIAGDWRVEGSYSNATKDLSVIVDLSEDAGGLIATRLKLPGVPAARLWLTGEGPLDQFAADIGLETDGLERLKGQFTLSSELTDEGTATGQQRAVFAARGDIAPLFAPEYRAFFGDDLRIATSVLWGGERGLKLEELDLIGQSIAVHGQADIGVDGWPRDFAIEAMLRNPDGGSVLLPGSGPKTWVDQAALELAFDSASSNRWIGTITLEGLMRQDVALGQARLSGSGRLEQSGAGQSAGVELVTADVAYVLDDLDFTNPALQSAAGNRLTGAIRALWERNAPLALEQFALAGSDFRLLGNLDVSGMADALAISGHVQADVGDLARWGGLIGRDLSGGGTFDLTGSGQPLGGAFDVLAQITTQDLKIGQAEADRLLSGQADLYLSVLRDQTGMTLRQLQIETPQLELKSSGFLGADRGDVMAEMTLNDIALIAADFSGALAANLSAERDGGDWQINSQIQQGQNADLNITGTVAPRGDRANLHAVGNAALGLVNPIIQPRSVDGMAALDLRLDGAFSLPSLSGRITSRGARFSAPALRLALGDINFDADIANAQAQIDLRGNLTSGGAVRLGGLADLSAPFIGELDLQLDNARLVDPELYDARIDADIGMSGPLAGGAAIGGRVTIREAELRIPTAAGPGIGTLDGLQHTNEPAAVRRTRQRAGLIEEPGSGATGPVYPLDIQVDAPGRMFVRGRGLDAELGGTVRIGGTSANVEPDGGLELLRGRLDILGNRLTLSEGLVQMQGSLLPWVRMVATTDVPDAQINVIVEGVADDPEITFTSQPDLPEDEVLALLLFGRSITEISAFQAAQLASAVATLAGHGGSGVIGNLRQKFGLDDFDVSTSATGGAEVKAGKYLSENLYSEVGVGQDGNTDINLILELSPSVTAKGGVGQDGNTSVGVFFERDY